MQIKFSIIVPVYKINEQDLIKCIESLLSQDFPDFEIILVDDGSPDNCGLICDEFSSKDQRIKSIHQENQGVSVARNNGLDNASGDYILFVDGDDVLSRNILSEINKTLPSDADIILFKYFTYSKIKNSINEIQYIEKIETSIVKTFPSRILNQNEPYKDYCICSPWGKVFRKNFLLKNSLRFNRMLRKSQDKVFALYCYNCMPVVYKLNVFGYNYKINTYSICNKFNPNCLAYYVNLNFAIKEYIDLYHPNDDNYLIYYSNMRIIFLYEMSISYFFNKDNNEKKKIRHFREYIKSLEYLNSIKKSKPKLLKKSIRLFAILLKFHGYFIIPLYIRCIYIIKKILTK